MTDKLLRRREVEELTALSTSSIYAMMPEGRFPKQVRVGRRAVRWRLSDVQAWIAEQDCKVLAA